MTARTARQRQLAVPAACSLLAAIVAGYMLTLPHFLTGVRSYGPGYDDGVYLGAATLLVHGSLPYRDFTLMHPPGILLLLSPVAGLGRVFGTSAAMGMARVLMLLISIVNPGLAAYAIRSRGRTAMAVCGGLMALWPLAPVGFETVRLEPSLVLFVLLAAVVAFDGKGDLASPRRVALGGLLVGAAIDTKVVGAAAAVGLVVACARSRRSLFAAWVGVAAALAVGCGPFFLASPGSFWHDVVVSQVGRHDPHGIGFFERFGLITGLASPIVQLRWSHIATLLAAVVLVAVVVACTKERGSFRAYHWFAIVTAATLVLGFLQGPDFYDYYAYSTTAVLAPLIGMSAAHYRSRWRVGVRPPRLGSAHAAVSGSAALFAVALLLVECINAKDYLSHTTPVSAAISREVPKGACVVTDTASLLLAADRFPSPQRGCPRLLDPIGLYLSTDRRPPGPPPYPVRLVAQWSAAFATVPYVVLSDPLTNRVPWTPQLEAEFAARFHLVAAVPPKSGKHQFAPGTYVYAATD